MGNNRGFEPEKQTRGLWEALLAGMVLGTNETDFMGYFTVSLSVDKQDTDKCVDNIATT